jgi:hypothetical protein
MPKAWVSIQSRPKEQLACSLEIYTVRRTNLDSFTSTKCCFSSKIPQYVCPECGERHRDHAMLIRHRKSVHNYQPYHTDAYLAKQASKNGQVEVVPKVVSTKTRGKRAARAAPYSLPATLSSPVTPVKVPEKVSYHDDFWKALIALARLSAVKPHDSQDVQIHLPATTLPGCDTPGIHQPAPNAPVQDVASAQFQSFTSEDVKHDNSYLLLNPQLDISTQCQAPALPCTQGDYTVSAGSSYPGYPITNATAFPPTSFGPLALPESGFQYHPNESLMSSYNSIPSSFTPGGTTLQTEPPFYSTTPEVPFFPSSYGPDAYSEPRSWPDWTNASSSTAAAPFSHFDLVSPEMGQNFNTWHQSNTF